MFYYFLVFIKLVEVPSFASLPKKAKGSGKRGKQFYLNKK